LFSTKATSHQQGTSVSIAPPSHPHLLLDIFWLFKYTLMNGYLFEGMPRKWLDGNREGIFTVGLSCVQEAEVFYQHLS
jgi:hypothetical protein